MKAAFMVWVLSLSALVALEAWSIFSSSFALASIWEWYAVPLGLPYIAWKTWAGICMVKALIFNSVEAGKPDGETSLAHTVGLLLAPWFSLFMAWVIK